MEEDKGARAAQYDVLASEATADGKGTLFIFGEKENNKEEAEKRQGINRNVEHRGMEEDIVHSEVDKQLLKSIFAHLKKEEEKSKEKSKEKEEKENENTPLVLTEAEFLEHVKQQLMGAADANKMSTGMDLMKGIASGQIIIKDKPMREPKKEEVHICPHRTNQFVTTIGYCNLCLQMESVKEKENVPFLMETTKPAFITEASKPAKPTVWDGYVQWDGETMGEGDAVLRLSGKKR